MQMINEDAMKHDTHNPIKKYLINKFYHSLYDLIEKISFNNVYEAGCGNGYITRLIRSKYKSVEIRASDISEDKISAARQEVPDVNFEVESIYTIKQPDNSYSLVISTEVLEHLEYPQKALEELVRISNKYIIVSVPNEPIFTILKLRNTPGHINLWSKQAFCNFVGKYCNIVEIKLPLPWIMLLCEKYPIKNKSF